MYGCNILLYHLNESSGLLRCDSTRLMIRSINTKLDQEIRSNCFTNGFADLNREFCTVLQRSAILISTGIHQWGKVLCKNKSMSAMNQNSVKSCFLHISSCYRKIICDTIHIIFCHCTNRNSGRVCTGHRSDCFLLIVERNFFFSAVNQLSQCDTVMLFDTVCICFYRIECLHIFFRFCKIKWFESRDTYCVTEVDICLTKNNAGISAFCRSFQFSIGNLCCHRVLCHKCECHRRTYDTVFVNFVADFHRA